MSDEVWRAGVCRLAFLQAAFYSEIPTVCLASILMTGIAAPAIVSFADAKSEVSMSSPPADRLLEGRPQQTVRNFFSDSTGQFFAGIWESSSGRWRVRYTENEFCHITEGEVRIESDDGAQWTFKTGDSFVIPAGFSGAWHVVQPVRKLYVIFEPASK